MPANIRKQTFYADTGDPETVNESTQYKAGELGTRITTTTGKSYQKIRLDSGATSATPVGVVASGQAAFWKDKSVYLVTNDIRFAWGADLAADNARNAVAGMFTTALTAGNYGVVQYQARGSALAAAGGTWTQGNAVIANSGSAGDFTTVAAGTAPTHKIVGWVRGARVSGKAPVDFELSEVPG